MRRWQHQLDATTKLGAITLTPAGPCKASSERPTPLCQEAFGEIKELEPRMAVTWALDQTKMAPSQVEKL